MTIITNPRPFGIRIAQTWQQIGLLFEMIEEHEVDTVVEVGVFLGGLAEMLLIRQEHVVGFHYFGVERDTDQLYPRILARPEVLIRDAWEWSTVEEVGKLINQWSGHALIYVDGGDKPREMTMYATILRPGDVMLAHDYPGETTRKSLIKFAQDFPYMREINPTDFREAGVSFWERI